MGGLWGMSVGRYAGHRVGRYAGHRVGQKLRKLVGEACGIGMAWAYLLNMKHDDPQDRTRLAAIHHAAGVEGKGE